MYQPYLDQQIHTFMREFLVVKRSQLLELFRGWGASSVNTVIDGMVKSGALYAIQDEALGDFITYSRTMGQYDEYRDIIAGLDVLCCLTSDDIRDYWIDHYPRSFGFITTDNVVHDVTVMTDYDWIGKRDNWLRCHRDSMVDADIAAQPEDPVCHIVLVDSPSTWEKIKDCGFSFYAIPTHAGKDTAGSAAVTLYEA